MICTFCLVQCNSKSKTKTVVQTSVDSNLTSETDKLLKLILKDISPGINYSNKLTIYN